MRQSLDSAQDGIREHWITKRESVCQQGLYVFLPAPAGSHLVVPGVGDSCLRNPKQHSH